MRRLTAVFLVLVLCAATLGTGYLGYKGARAGEAPTTEAPPTVPVERGDVVQNVSAPGKLAGTREAWLSFDVAGRLDGLNVRAGDAVRAGTVLATLDSGPLEEALEVARAAEARDRAEHARRLAEAQYDVQIAEARLKEAQARSPGLASAQAAVDAARAESASVRQGPDPQELAKAQAQLANAEADLKQAEAAYDRVKWRNDVGALPESLALQRATNSYELARAGYEQASRPTDPAAVAAAEAAVRQAQAAYEQARGQQAANAQELAVLEAGVGKARLALEGAQAGPDPSLREAVQRAERALDAAVLVAPFDGVVLAVNASAGQAVAAGEGILLLADPRAVELVSTVVEEDLPLIQPGQAVEVIFDALPGSPVAGRVARILPQRTDGDRPLYPIYIEFDELPQGLAPGMTADATVLIARRDGVLRLPRALVGSRSDGTSRVTVWNGSQREERSITVGLRGDVYVEILDGLTEGERVVRR